MQYNQPMIDLVYAIRSHLSQNEKAAIKTTNPELLEDLAEIYRKSSNVDLCKQIESLLRLAGSTWLDLLQKGPNPKWPELPSGKLLRYAAKTASTEGKTKVEATGGNEAKLIAPSASTLLAFH